MNKGLVHTLLTKNTKIPKLTKKLALKISKNQEIPTKTFAKNF